MQELRSLPEPDARAVEAYREIVGASREVASRHITKRLDLDEDLRPLMAQHDASEPWQVISSMRKSIYDEMVSDPQVIRDNQWPHTVGLLRVARETYCRTGLATMSYLDEVLHVLRALDLVEDLDVILTREDVQQAKPDPEIYLLAAEKLDVPPAECMAFEDSPNGVRAAVDAGMNVIAIATPFTVAAIHSSEVLDHAWVVHEAEELPGVLRQRIEEHNRVMH